MRTTLIGYFKAEFNKPPKCYHDIDKDIIDFIFKGFDINEVKTFTQLAEDKKDNNTKP